MILVPAIFAGLLTGALRARARGGDVKDIALWSVVYAIIFALIGLFVTIALNRSA